jgi:hypothetical protein
LEQVSTWSLVINSIIAGKKDALISRLMKAKEANDNPDTVKQRLKAFLEPTGAMGRNEKPTITAWYANTFKSVDRFNALLGILKSKAKMMKKESVWWYYIFAMLVVNSYVLWNDIKATDSVEDETVSLKQFVLDLCDELL